jgi:hypothetical protein
VKLKELTLSNTNHLSGSILTNIGQLSLLELLHLSISHLTGSIPSEIGFLVGLTDLMVENNMLTGSLPSEMGRLTDLLAVYMSNNLLTGSIPADLVSISSLAYLGIINTDITGTVPPELCISEEEFTLGGAQSFSVVIDVTCGFAICDCCFCSTSSPPAATPSESVASSEAPSTSAAPSYTHVPTVVPTTSLKPSSSASPSDAPNCLPFSSIVSFGSQLGISEEDEGIELVALPFLFDWRGTGDNGYNNVVVVSNGVVYLGTDTYFSTGCCEAFPIAADDIQAVPRIAVAQGDWNPALTGAIYTAMVGEAFVISWEGVPEYAGISELPFNFQVALYANGVIELRWGEGASELLQPKPALQQESKMKLPTLPCLPLGFLLIVEALLLPMSGL